MEEILCLSQVKYKSLHRIGMAPYKPAMVPHCYNSSRGDLKTMADLSKIVGQLRSERDRLQQQLSGLNAALAAFAGVYSNGGSKRSTAAKRTRRRMSAKGRAAIRRAQKARWAKVRAANK
jgi:hypothetical protein